MRLIDEAARILGEEGPSALSVRRLAGRAGTSTMAVYTHFGSMASVVDAVATEGFRRLIDHVDAVDVTDDPIADLAAMAAAYRANALENRHLYAVMFGAMAEGRLREGDPAAVAAQFWSALHGYAMLELSGNVRIVDDPEHTVLWPMLAHLLQGQAPPPR